MTAPPASTLAPMPRGRTRVSNAVLDATATLAASEVAGVLSVEGLAVGAAVGAAVGGAMGLAQGGPVGAAVGASLGASAGAAASHALRDHSRRETLAVVAHTDGGAIAPPLTVQVIVRYGEDLVSISDHVRRQVRRALTDALGLEPGRVSVEVTDVVWPEAEFAQARQAGEIAAPTASD